MLLFYSKQGRVDIPNSPSPLALLIQIEAYPNVYFAAHQWPPNYRRVETRIHKRVGSGLDALSVEQYGVVLVVVEDVLAASVDFPVSDMVTYLSI